VKIKLKFELFANFFGYLRRRPDVDDTGKGREIGKAKRCLVWFLAFVLFFTQTASIPILSGEIFDGGEPLAYAAEADLLVKPAEPDNEIERVLDLVVLVVDKNIGQGNYDGLAGGNHPGIEVDTVGNRVVRYAEDLVANYDATDVRTIFYDPATETVEDIAAALENLYLNGDDRNNRMTGVVFVGDIPLPVVNKQGNRYISMFPYTDYVDKAYILNESTGEFEFNPVASFPKPEVWHGVLPAKATDRVSMQKLASFFDKNHLYYQGEDEFADFDQKIFFADLLHEEEQLNDDLYKYYVDYLDNQEDLAYTRFNKYWARDLTQQKNSELPINNDNPMNQGEGSFAASIQGDPFANFPDIHLREPISQSLLPYYKLFSRYISTLNDWTDYTGRYKVKPFDSDVHSVVGLISTKDKYNEVYLRSVNDAMEKKINELVAKVEKPMPILENSTISGGFLAGDDIVDEFEKRVSGALFPIDYYDTPEMDIPLQDVNDKALKKTVNFRHHYINEVTDKLYINGTEAGIIESAKLCMPLLGSTKTEYFDENMNFNPKAVDGVYSVMVRALRSDNIQTAGLKHEGGVNTRMLSPFTPNEVTEATLGAYDGEIDDDGTRYTGAIIEDNAAYGIPAFSPNMIFANGDDYKNPFADRLQKGDVIVAVNGRKMSHNYTFDIAIEDSFKAVEKLIDAVQKEKLNLLANYDHNLMLLDKPSGSRFYGLEGPPPPQEILLSTPTEIVNSTALQNGNLGKNSVVSGSISIDFYREGIKIRELFGFSLQVSSKTKELRFGSTSDPKGSPEVVVLFERESLPAGFGWDREVDGVIFPMNQNKSMGFDREAYDAAAGCNYSNANENSDRCFPKVALTPIFDAAGGKALVKTLLPSADGAEPQEALIFPENVQKEEGINSGNLEAYDNLLFQFPGGPEGSHYLYEDIDEVYYDSCYSALPSMGGFSRDSNPYDFPLDPDTNEGGVDFGLVMDLIRGFLDSIFLGGPPYYHINEDYYGRYMKGIGNFVSNGDTQDEFDKSPGFLARPLDASEIILNDSPRVTLKDFSDRYGLFDGIDNDGDKTVDYEWKDSNGDDVPDLKWYDFEEADEQYGIPSSHLDEITRKMLSSNASYTIPYGIDVFPYDNFDSSIRLDVEVGGHEVDGEVKMISSMILHNEPTMHTIMEQVLAQATTSLPIDNPRYVAFQTLLSLDETPEEPQSYFPRSTHKIYYPNIFADDVKNLVNLKVKLRLVANQLALLPDAEKIFDDSDLGKISRQDFETEKAFYAALTIRLYIEKLEPVLTAGHDHPVSGFNMERAAANKLPDVLAWKTMSIDDKHEYVLEYYLNDKKNAFVADQTLFSPAFPYKKAKGYEMAYVVLNGEDDYFDMSFNRDVPEEEDPNFGPLGVATLGARDVIPAEKEGDDDAVDLWYWLQELLDYIASIDPSVGLADACGFVPSSAKKDRLNSGPVRAIDLSTSTQSLVATSGQALTVGIQGMDEAGNLVAGFENNQRVTLEIGQNAEKPIFGFEGNSQQIMSEGMAIFDLVSTGEEGVVTLTAVSEEGVRSNAVQVRAAGKRVELLTYTADELEGFDDLMAAIIEEEYEEALKASSEGGGAGENGDDGGSFDGDSSGASGAGLDAISEITSSLGQALGDDDDSFGGDGIGTTALLDDGEGVDGEGVAGGDGFDGGDIADLDSGVSGVAGDGDGDDEANNRNEAAEKIDKDIKEVLATEEEKNIIVLKSSPIEEGEEGADGADEGDGVEGGGGDEGATENTDMDAGAEDADEGGDDEDKDKTANDSVDENDSEDGIYWLDYYFRTDYYSQYLSNDLDAAKPRYLAEIPDDDNPFILEENGGFLIEQGKSFVANGEELMKIEAQVVKVDGRIESDRNHNVRFVVEDISVDPRNNEIVTFEGGQIVESENGVATAYLRSGTKTGQFKLRAEVLRGGQPDQSYATLETTITLMAGPPEKIEIKSDSHALVANGQSKTNVQFILRDQYNNIANNSFSSVSAFAGAIVEFDPRADENSDLLGVQISTIDGSASLDLFASKESGEVEVFAVLMDTELEESFIDVDNDWEQIDFGEEVVTNDVFKVYDDLDLELSFFDDSSQSISAIKADGESKARLGIKLKAGDKTVSEYEGVVEIEVLSENLIETFKELPKKMIQGKLDPANIVFKSKTKTGKAEVLVKIPGFISDTVTLDLRPAEVVSIELTTNVEEVYTGGENKVELKARLLDANGNLVVTDDSTVVSFRTTAATRGLVNFSDNSAQALNGVATVKATGSSKSGTANVYAEAAGLGSGMLPIAVKKHVTSKKVAAFNPRVLYMSLLGGAFGGASENNLAETFIYSGKLQALATITANPDADKRLVYLDAYGKLEQLEANLDAKVVMATDSYPYQKVIFSDPIEATELVTVTLIPKNGSQLMLLEKDAEVPAGDLIYLQKVTENEAYKFEEKEDGVEILQDGEVKLKIDRFGRININDDTFSLDFAREAYEIPSEDFTFVVIADSEVLATIHYKQNFGKAVKMLPEHEEIGQFRAGLYLKLNTASSRYKLIEGLSRSSSKEEKGSYLVDAETPIEATQKPGFGPDSLEKVGQKFGLGFEGTNKHMLLMAAGNSVGMSHLPYASEVGIIYGDPMMRLEEDPNLVSPTSGYSKDLGQQIYAGSEEIVEMLDFDFNGDDYDDLLLVYEDGLVRLLENVDSNQRFHDRGYILNIYGEVISSTKIDVNNDGFDDLIVGTKESCHVDDQCLTLLVNDDGHFLRESLNLELDDKKAYEIKAGDMNADGCEDVVLTDSEGILSVFYNQVEDEQCVGLELEADFSRNFGYSLEDNVNLKNNLFINYPGMSQPDEGEADYLQDNGIDEDGDGRVDEASNLNSYIQFILESDIQPNTEGATNAAAAQGALLASESISGKEIPAQTFPTEYDFLHLPEDGRLGLSSAKQALDVNGGSVGVGDRIEYLISLENNSASSIRNLLVSDTTAPSMSLILESLECADAGCSDDLEWLESGMSLRSHVIKGLTVPAGGRRIIRYSMIVDEVPEIRFDLGNNFSAVYPEDKYLDIMVKPEVNPDGVITFVYSQPELVDGKVAFSVKRVLPSSASDEAVSDLFDETFTAQGQASPDKLLAFAGAMAGVDPDADVDDLPEVDPELMDSAEQTLRDSQADSDYNGCADSFGGAVNLYEDYAGAAAAFVEGALSALRCSGGGCLPIPYNKAFFAPDGPTPGTPIIAFGASSPWVFPFPSGSTVVPTDFRIYVSPTLTMALGGAICGGPSVGHQGVCFAFAYPGGMPGVCDALNAAVDDLASGIQEMVGKATDSNVDPAIGQAAIISDGEGNSPRAEDTSLSSNFGDAGDPISAAVKANIKIPGFPSVLVNWMDAQTDEIYNKLLDFPTFTLIIPGFENVMKDVKKFSDNAGSDWKSPYDFANTISSLPFLTIEGKEVLIRIPAISEKELEKWKRQAHQWKKHMKKEIERFTDINCSLDSVDETRRNLCDKILVDMNDLVRSVQKLMELIDKLALLPVEILNWRLAEAKYATQIICYMDVIMQVTGGYIKKQNKIITSWLKAVRDVIRIFKEWQAVLNLSVDFQESCDKCKNDRFSKLALLLQLFVAIPEPPVFPLPKLPDIIIDLSQIKAGTKIIWPDAVFKPEPILLPDLPFINLPDLIPGLEFKIPGFGIPELPDFRFLPDLPDLPPIPIPELPDLPRPPKIPQLPNIIVDIVANLKPIFKILCLLKNGLVPVPEWGLATEIETLTQPSIQIVLPLIKSLSVQLPGIQYDYVREIRANLRMNFEINTDIVYLLVDAFAMRWNKSMRTFVSRINEYTQIPYGLLINAAIQEAVDKAYAEINIPQQGRDNDSFLNSYVEPKDLLAQVEPGNLGVTPLLAQLEDPAFQANFPELSQVRGNMEEINNVLSDYLAEVESQVQGPESYNLVAGYHMLDHSNPQLNRSLAEVERDIAAADLPDTPALRKMAKTRDQLVAYTNALYESTEGLGDIKDLKEFGRILADSDEKMSRLITTIDIEPYGEALIAESETMANSEARLVAAVEDAAAVAKSFDYSLLGEVLEDEVNTVASEGSNRLIAANINFSAEEAGDGNHAAQTQAPPIGFYIVADDVNENVLNYTKELKGTTHTLFSDVDKDSDYDILLALGSDVYLKRNHDFKANIGEGEHRFDLRDRIKNYLPEAGVAVQNVASPFENTKTADLSWTYKGEGVVAYELLVKNSFKHDDEDYVYRYISLINAMDSDESIELLDLLDLEAPESQEAQADSPVKIVELTNADDPNLTLEIENGNYYAIIYALDAEGARSLQSNYTIVAPQICSDKEPPFPAITRTNHEVAIYGDLEIDASGSFDTDGEVVHQYIEVLPYATEEIDPLNENSPLRVSNLGVNAGPKESERVGENLVILSKPDSDVFKIGPFEEEGDLGEHLFVLHAVDQTGNSSQQEISVNVFTPEITLDETFARTGIAIGETIPPIVELPFTLMRERYIYRVVDGEMFLVAREEKVTNGRTDDRGRYSIGDLSSEGKLEVENSDNEKVAEINPDNGNIGVFDEDYHTEVREAEVPDSPTAVVIIGPNGEELSKVSLVADPNHDITVHEEFAFAASNVDSLYGVHVDDVDLEDRFEWLELPGNDISNPGGAVLVEKEERKSLLSVDTQGNLLILDERVRLEHKDNDHELDPLLIEVWFEENLIAEVYIATGRLRSQVIGEAQVPAQGPEVPSEGVLSGAIVEDDPFAKYPEELRALLADLDAKDILDILDTADGLGFDLDDFVTRQEFVKALIRMLCIIPRPEAYGPYADGEGYFDVPYSQEALLRFYPYIQEGTLLGLVEGYKGERDTGTGMLPFKPEATINRAEAVKVILEALELVEVLDLDGLEEGEPWYEAFMEAGQELTPYIREGQALRNNFIITPEEALEPNKEMSFTELVVMIERVLDLYNCFNIDEDGDGIGDFCEEVHEIDDPEADPDGDGLNNLEECAANLDPNDGDSDGGGTSDAEEILMGTDPKNPFDDRLDSDKDGLSDLVETEIYKSDPFDPDTDDGGVYDGDEVARGSDPLYKPDDDGEAFGSGDGDDDDQDAAEDRTIPGIYIVPAECNSCPCVSTVANDADVIPSDVFFPTIMVEYDDYYRPSQKDKVYIFSKGNEVSVNKLSK
jgi:uncharacterized repeat protein (TIGR01451 family)